MASESEIKRVLDLLTIAPRGRVESLGVKARGHTESLRSVTRSDNIVALGISEKISNNHGTGELALTFYVEEKIPLSELRAGTAVPAMIPNALARNDGVLTDVVVIGKLRPEINVTRKVIQPGNSIGHVDVSAGTFGAVVTDGKSNFLLSNSHVLANSGLGKKGDVIVYPGVLDGGVSPADLVAKLHAFKKFTVGGAFVNRTDCAIVKPTGDRLLDLTAEIKGLGLPKGVIQAERGMKLVKVGRTTGKTEGEVRDVHFRFVLDYDGVGEVGFVDQVFCTRYSKPGDSGALVLDKQSGKAMGLHFAGADGGSVFNPIEQVLSDLKVTLVTHGRQV
ncbi:S1 family peptidase [Dyadobacter sp. MSC1_007]|jgi:hypothetical protein|uniref:S1 family peptidase n=1 Tax=Dyadobacter sp. MSC1_007 TaxID=2909264 RepID=UPI00202E24B4|nr:S1 family peptidase [Dyadobacter sp. MSC1_007]